MDVGGPAGINCDGDQLASHSALLVFRTCCFFPTTPPFAAMLQEIKDRRMQVCDRSSVMIDLAEGEVDVAVYLLSEDWTLQYRRRPVATPRLP